MAQIPVIKGGADKGTVQAALKAAGGDAERLIDIGPHTVLVVNYAGFPVEHWTKKAWRRPGRNGLKP